MASSRPPRLARWLLHICIRGDAREFIEGDLLEEHHDRVIQCGGAERTREIGIRIAVRANPGRVAAWVVRGAAGLAVVGVLVGYGASILVPRLLESRLYGVEPFDPITWAASAAALLIVAAAAAAQPALRAAHHEASG